MDSGVLAELRAALPELATRLQQVASKFPDYSSSSLTPINPGGPEIPAPVTMMKRVGRRAHPSLPEDEVAPKIETGTRKMNAKPGSTKAKFSSITGPDIYYDGNSQQCLFECWTTLNSKRGVLRKEMMLIRRKKVLTLPTANYGYSDSDDELEADDAESEKEETEESRQRLKAEEEKKREEDEWRSKVLEHIDGCLDKAARACENAATVWLKGEGCMGHVLFITARMIEAVQKINAELGKDLPDDDDYDEGFEEELEAEHHTEEELPHKKAAAGDGQRAGEVRRFQPPPTSTQPVEVAG